MLNSALRYLRRSPSFALFSVAILALGIASAVTIFSVVNALILAPLPYAGGERIVRVMNKLPKLGLRRNVSGPDFEDWRAQSKSFAALARFNGGEQAITVKGQGFFAQIYSVSTDFFDVFAVKPAAGRLFDEHSVVISDEFWHSRFQGGKAIGETVKISQKLYTVAGIMPPGLDYPGTVDVWMQSANDVWAQSRTANNYRAIGRLREGGTMEAAQSELDGIARGLSERYPDSNRNRGIGIERLQDQLAAPYRETLVLLLGAAALILLIACANISSLTLAKAQARQKEFAIRASIGASTGRILAQVLVESLLIGIVSAGVGLMMASWLMQGLALALPAGFPRADAITVDWRVLAFTAIVGTLASLLFGIYPAWKVSRIDLTSAMKGGDKGMLAGGSGLFRRGLAVAQVALSLVMLCGALLLVRSMTKLLKVDMGMDAKNVLVSYIHVPASTLEEHKDATRTFSLLLNEIRQRPQVQAASAIMGMPTGKYGSDGGYAVVGQQMPKDLNQLPQAGFRVTAPGFFETMHVALKSGRDFTEGDAYDKPFVAIINESLARKSFSGVDPIGRQIICGLDDPRPMTIIGVVADVRHSGLDGALTAELYMPYHQHPYHSNELQVSVRTKGDPRPLSEAMREMVERTNPDIAVQSQTLESMLLESVAAPRFRTTLLIAMASLALILACAGLYGVLTYLVSRRLPEFGLRMALGADAVNIAGLVWREAGVILGVGFAIGLGLVYLLGNALRSFLFGVEPNDVTSIATAIGGLAVAALLASAVPSLGATRADPLTVLRSE